MAPSARTQAFSSSQHENVELEYDEKVVPEEGRDELIALPGILGDITGFQSRSHGRVSVWEWHPDWSDVPFFVRQFVHGGLLGKLWGGLFVTDRSMRRELKIGSYVWQQGLPTCRPVALRIERSLGMVRRAHYITQALPGAMNVLDFCREPLKKISVPRRQQLARQLGLVIARMHDYGVYHSDLNLKNLLILPADRKDDVAIIDFKKARLEDRIGLERGLKNLIRLDRSILKWPASRRMVSKADRIRVFRTYVTARTGAGTDWREKMHTLQPHHWLHYLGRKQ